MRCVRTNAARTCEANKRGAIIVSSNIYLCYNIKSIYIHIYIHLYLYHAWPITLWCEHKSTINDFSSLTLIYYYNLFIHEYAFMNVYVGIYVKRQEIILKEMRTQREFVHIIIICKCFVALVIFRTIFFLSFSFKD